MSTTMYFMSLSTHTHTHTHTLYPSHYPEVFQITPTENNSKVISPPSALQPHSHPSLLPTIPPVSSDIRTKQGEDNFLAVWRENVTLSGGPGCSWQGAGGEGGGKRRKLLETRADTLLFLSSSVSPHLFCIWFPSQGPTHAHTALLAVISSVCWSAFHVFLTVLPACCSWPCAASVRIGRIRNSPHQSFHFARSQLQVNIMNMNWASLQMLKWSETMWTLKSLQNKEQTLILSLAEEPCFLSTWAWWASWKHVKILSPKRCEEFLTYSNNYKLEICSTLTQRAWWWLCPASTGTHFSKISLLHFQNHPPAPQTALKLSF